jgi:hypothetical protein
MHTFLGLCVCVCAWSNFASSNNSVVETSVTDDLYTRHAGTQRICQELREPDFLPNDSAMPFLFEVCSFNTAITTFCCFCFIRLKMMLYQLEILIYNRKPPAGVQHYCLVFGGPRIKPRNAGRLSCAFSQAVEINSEIVSQIRQHSLLRPFLFILTNNVVIELWPDRVKQPLYTTGQALVVLGGWGSRISRQSAHEDVNVVSPTHRPP